MAAKSSKNNMDHLEKIKKEMTDKRKKAKVKEQEISVNQQEEENATAQVAQSKAELITQSKEEPLVTEPTKAKSERKPLQKKEVTEQVEQKKMELVVLRIGREEYAFPISAVKEIIRIPDLTQVPNAPSYVLGLCALRGELLPVIDGRKLFGLEQMQQNDNSRIVIIEINQTRVGLVTDKVSEVISVDESMIKEPPSSIKQIDGGVVSGILLMDQAKRIVMILDAAKIIKADVFQVNQDVLESEIEKMRLKQNQEEQIIVFNVGSSEYAFPIENVKEIIRIPEVFKLPNTANYIEGVLTIRNQLMAVVNLGKLLGETDHAPDEASRVIVLTEGEFTFGVIVDRVSQVMRVSTNTYKKGSVGTSNAKKEYINGFFNLNEGQRLIIMLDMIGLISNEEIINTQNFDLKESLTDAVQDEKSKAVDKVVIFKLNEQEY
jgi:purine-binding chemotaxis protein CheW